MIKELEFYLCPTCGHVCEKEKCSCGADMDKIKNGLHCCAICLKDVQRPEGFHFARVVICTDCTSKTHLPEVFIYNAVADTKLQGVLLPITFRADGEEKNCLCTFTTNLFYGMVQCLNLLLVAQESEKAISRAIEPEDYGNGWTLLPYGYRMTRSFGVDPLTVQNLLLPEINRQFRLSVKLIATQ